MITTRRTAVSDRDFETKQNTVIETDFNTDTSAYVDPVIKPLRADAPVVTKRITPAMDNSDIMPTIKVSKKEERKVVENEEIEKPAQAVRVVDAKTKAVMITYLAVAFVMALIVLATGLIITSRTTEVAALENDVRTAYNTILEQQDTMDHLSDEGVVGSKAEGMGMTSAGAAQEIELIPIGDEVTYEERTNAFDRFCDFISQLLGG